MADKPTTPETPQGSSQGGAQAPRRKKRAAPTIDLTATEVPPAASASKPHSAAPPPPPAQERPMPKHETSQGPGKSSSGNQSNGARARSGMPMIFAGLVGAVVMSVILFVLWLSGLVPVRNGEPSATGAMDSKAIDALGQRLSKIEGVAGKLPASDPALAERIAVADNAMKSLGLALTALNRRSDDVAANAANARERAEAAEKAVTELRASLQDAAKNTAAGVPAAELDELQKRIATLEQSAKATREDVAKTAGADTSARLALSAAALRDAVVSGAPFTVELAQAKSLAADDKALAPLEPFAASGVPTQSALAQELRALLPGMVKASGAQAPAGGFFERLEANASKLVHKIPMDAPVGDDAPAVLARIEIAAAKADIAAALSDLGKLPDATRAPAQGWIAKVQARQMALDAVRALAADTARALGQR
jgi:hypothetical protein